jgi:hypothetical protein
MDLRGLGMLWSLLDSLQQLPLQQQKKSWPRPTSLQLQLLIGPHHAHSRWRV